MIDLDEIYGEEKTFLDELANDLDDENVWFNDFEFARYHVIDGERVVSIFTADRRTKEEGTNNQARAKINILVGVYDDEQAEQREIYEKTGVKDTQLKCQAWRDVVNIIEEIQRFLLSLKNRILENKYFVLGNMKSCLFEDQPQPIYFGQIETEWDISRPLMPNFY